MVAFVCGALSSVVAWGTVLAAPWAARRAVARLDYDNVYTVGIAGASIAVLLGLVALVLGLMHVRRLAGGALGAAAAGIGASSVLGVVMYLLGTWVVMPGLG